MGWRGTLRMWLVVVVVLWYFVVGGSDGPIHFPECLDLLLSLFSI